MSLTRTLRPFRSACLAWPIVLVAGEPAYLLDRVSYPTDRAYAGRFDPNRSPEMHGAVTGVFKNQIDWLPLEIGSVRPTQGRTLAVMP